MPLIVSRSLRVRRAFRFWLWLLLPQRLSPLLLIFVTPWPECRPGGRRAWMPAVFRPSQDGESKNPGTNELPASLRRGGPCFCLLFFGPTKKSKSLAARRVKALLPRPAAGSTGQHQTLSSAAAAELISFENRQKKQNQRKKIPATILRKTALRKYKNTKVNRLINTIFLLKEI